jgi:hypothetical protein
MTITANSVDITSLVSGLRVEQNLTNQVNSATFSYLKAGDKTYIPTVMEAIEIFDGADQIFSGKILKIEENHSIEFKNKSKRID